MNRRGFLVAAFALSGCATAGVRVVQPEEDPSAGISGTELPRGPVVLWEVEDTGIGIADQDLEMTATLRTLGREAELISGELDNLKNIASRNATKRRAV